MSDDPAGGAAMPPSALRSRSDFHHALHWGLGHAVATRARRLTLVDADFAAWPLDDAALLQSLTAFLQLPQRRLVLLAYRFDTVQRGFARFVAWRRNWAHAVEAWTPPEDTEVRLPTLAIDDDRLSLQVFDTTHWRGRLQLDDREVRQWQDEIDALLQRCEAAFPVHHLGL